MPAEHIFQPGTDTDEMYRDGCRVVITSDLAGVPIVKVSCDPSKYVLVYYHEDIIFENTPDVKTRSMLEAAAEEKLAARTVQEQITDTIMQRAASGDPTDPLLMAAEEAAKLVDSARASASEEVIP